MVKHINWVGSSLKDLKELPNVIQKRFGYALHLVESGCRPANGKTLSGFGSAKVNEIREDDRGGTYRAVYTVEIQDRIFVLHVFQKKSNRGRETTRQDMKTIKERLKEVENFLLLKEKE